MDNLAYETTELREIENNQQNNLKYNTSITPANNIPSEDEGSGREEWANKAEFLLSCISMSVGFGNVWRFPFVALENGGGAFLIPYVLVLIFIGRPLYYLEFYLGQFPSSGPGKIWELSPAFRGVGYGQVLCTWVVSTFYVMLMALCVFYFFASFSSVLPWSICGAWAGPTCVDASKMTLGNMSFGNATFGNATFGNATLGNMSFGNATFGNATFEYATFGNSSFVKTSATEEYFMKEVLQIDYSGFENGLGFPNWRLALCLIFSWIIVFIVQCRGVGSSGKAAYFTALFPYAVMLTMLIRGATLPGAARGVLYFITPRWEKLLDPEVWYAAVDQAFFSLGIGFGNLIMLASYNKFNNDIYIDATIITTVDTLTCLLSGLTTFSILGHLAQLLNVNVEDVVQGGGTALAFISYPDALARFEMAPQVFSVLFFGMLFTLGIGSAVPYTGVPITAISDQFPGLSKYWITVCLCVMSCAIGLVYTTPQGQFIFTLANYYAGGVAIIGLMVLEIAGVVWVYGIKRLIIDIKFMLNRDTGMYWKLCWTILNPAFLIIVFIYSRINVGHLTYGSYVFDDISTGVGKGLSILAGTLVPLLFVLELLKSYKKCRSLSEAFRNIFKPSSDWGPKDLTLRKQYIELINTQLKSQ